MELKYYIYLSELMQFTSNHFLLQFTSNKSFSPSYKSYPSLSLSLSLSLSWRMVINHFSRPPEK